MLRQSSPATAKSTALVTVATRALVERMTSLNRIPRKKTSRATGMATSPTSTKRMRADIVGTA